MTSTQILLSICTRCRDDREDVYDSRGGTRLAEAFMKRVPADVDFSVRGVYCMSQCKRSCVVSFTAPDRFTYTFGDLDPENPGDLDAILNFTKMYKNAPEGFVLRNDRPKVMRAGILGRFPPIETTSELVSTLKKVNLREKVSSELNEGSAIYRAQVCTS